jgi:hypothetical protein
MAAFSRTSFDTSAFSVNAFDFGPSPTPPQIGGGGFVLNLRRERKKRYEIDDEVVRVIEDVAARQVEVLEQDKQKIFEELTRELELKRVEFDARYLEVLSQEREILIDAEIAEHFRKIKVQEEELMLLVLMAANI